MGPLTLFQMHQYVWGLKIPVTKEFGCSFVDGEVKFDPSEEDMLRRLEFLFDKAYKEHWKEDISNKLSK